MALGDGELADTDQAVHLTGILVAEQGGRLAQTHGQIAVGTLAVQVHLILEGAGHGTQREALLGLVGRIAHDEHTVQIVIPVAGDLIQLTLGHQRRFGQQIAGLLLGVLHPALQQLNHAGALGQQDGQALTDAVHRGEILQLTAQLVVVTLHGLLAGLQVLIQLLFLGEGHAVNTLEGLAVAVAPPVSGVAGSQLNAVALDAAGGIHMGAGAQIHELALPVEGNVGVGRQIVDQLHLVGLLTLLHELEGLVPGQFKPLQLQLFLADLPHFGLDIRQIVGGKGKGGVHIIIEAVVDAGADGQLHLRVQALNGLRQNMGAGMPIGLAVLFVFKGVVHFFAHKKLLLVLGRDKKSPPLMFFRGEVKTLYSTVPPCLRRCAVARVLCNGRIPSCSSQAAQEWYRLRRRQDAFSRNVPLFCRKQQLLLRHCFSILKL